VGENGGVLVSATLAELIDIRGSPPECEAGGVGSDMRDCEVEVELSSCGPAGGRLAFASELLHSIVAIAELPGIGRCFVLW
jgi:hypothetical protein